MLRLGVSSVVLTGWLVAMPLVGSAVEGQLPKLTIKGSITYEADGTLPSDSRGVIELRHIPALPAAPAVAEQRIDLKGKASPVSFEFAVERYRLVVGGGVTYIVRVAILSGTRAIWISDDVRIDVTPQVIRYVTANAKDVSLAGSPATSIRYVLPRQPSTSISRRPGGHGCGI